MCLYLLDPYLSPSSGNGVTSLVAGNCSISMAPCPKPLRGFVSDLCDSVEDIPADVIKQTVKCGQEASRKSAGHQQAISDTFAMNEQELCKMVPSP